MDIGKSHLSIVFSFSKSWDLNVSTQTDIFFSTIIERYEKLPIPQSDQGRGKEHEK